MPFDESEYNRGFNNKNLRIGIMTDFYILPPSTAALRAITEVTDSLSAAGHQIVKFELT